MQEAPLVVPAVHTPPLRQNPSGQTAVGNKHNTWQIQPMYITSNVKKPVDI